MNEFGDISVSDSESVVHWSEEIEPKPTHMLFFVELWESVFKAGMTPALVTATHALFCLLLVLLGTMAVYTRSIHFFNLFIIAVCLYGLVIWFMKELEAIKLKSNEDLSSEKLVPSAESTGSSNGAAKAQPATPVRKRKT